MKNELYINYIYQASVSYYNKLLMAANTNRLNQTITVLYCKMQEGYCRSGMNQNICKERRETFFTINL